MATVFDSSTPTGRAKPLSQSLHGIGANGGTVAGGPTPIANIVSTGSLTTVQPTISPTVTVQPSSTQASQTPTAAPSSALPLTTLLPAILVPVVVVLVIAPIVVFTCLHYRNKRRDRERLNSEDNRLSPLQEAPLVSKSSDAESFTLPMPLKDSERTRKGSLGHFSKRESVADEKTFQMYERKPQSTSPPIGGPRPSASAAAAAATAATGAGAAGGFGASTMTKKSTLRVTPDSTRQPSPTLPPKTTKAPSPLFRPKSTEAWPLPAIGGLPSPANSSDALGPTNPGPVTNTKSKTLKPPRQPAMPQQQQPIIPRTSSARSSSQYEYDPDASLGSRPPPGAIPRSNPSAARNPFKSNRDSDEVSELSFRESMPARKDSDNISVVSALTERSRGNTRRGSPGPDTTSFVSAISPDEMRSMQQDYFRR